MGLLRDALQELGKILLVLLRFARGGMLAHNGGMLAHDGGMLAHDGGMLAHDGGMLAHHALGVHGAERWSLSA